MGEPIAKFEPGQSLFWPTERWRALQAQALQKHLNHAQKSGLNRAAKFPDLEPMIEGGHVPLERIIEALPLTTKDQLAAAGQDAWAVAPEQVRDWVCTSGTLGRPLDVPLTERDLQRLAENEAAALTLAGVTRGDLCIIAVSMERMFVAGMAYDLGAKRCGAASVRMGPRLAEQPAMLGELVARLGKDRRVFVIAVPSYLLHALPPEKPLAGIIAIGEPVKSMPRDGDMELSYNILGARLAERFGCPVMSTYAMTETCTTFAEGPGCSGGHLNPELAIVEVLDDSTRPLRESIGEIVVTPLGVEGMPLVRFRTGDMAALYHAPCPCGRTTPRIGPIVGRRQQLLKVRGVSIYPQAILEAIRSVRAVADCAIIAEEESPLSDRVTLFLHAPEAADELKLEVEGRLRTLLRIVPEIRYVTAAEIRDLQSAPGRKTSRFIDRRSSRDHRES